MANEKRLIDGNRLKMRMIAFATAIKREYLSIEAIVDTINTEDTVDAVGLSIVGGNCMATMMIAVALISVQTAMNPMTKIGSMSMDRTGIGTTVPIVERKWMGV